MAAFKVNVNGKSLTADVDGQKPLLWVLREDLNLVGAKFGCGLAQCGACTVHIDGQPVRSCVLPIEMVGNKKVTTIENMANDSVGKKVQAAWTEVDVAQCGYCQAGQIMAATALLKKKAKPTDADIDEAMSDNICRCATYTRIRKAIKIASGQKVA